MLRDAVIWAVYEDYYMSKQVAREPQLAGLAKLHEAFNNQPHVFEEDVLARKLIETGWGKLE